MRTAEHNRLGGASGRLRADIQAHITWLDQRLVALDNDLDTMLRASPVWRERDELLPQCAGHWARVCPDAGARSAGVGHAEPPAHRRPGRGCPLQSRQWHPAGRRTIWGGRAPVRAVLYEYVGRRQAQSGAQSLLRPLMCRWQSQESGLTACMRKLLTILNAMGKHQTPGNHGRVYRLKISMDP